MTNFAIFPRDTAGAMLQHLTEAPDAAAAFAEFAEIVGDGADRDAYSIVEITADQLAEIDAWDGAGAPANHAPDWLDDAICSA